MSLTRRDAAKLVLAGSAFAAAPLSASARPNEEWVARLKAELDRHLVSGCDGRFTITAFGQGNPRGRVQMASIVRLDWPPGTRSRRFDGFGDDDDAAFRALVNLALLEFAGAWPGCVV